MHRLNRWLLLLAIALSLGHVPLAQAKDVLTDTLSDSAVQADRMLTASSEEPDPIVLSQAGISVSVIPSPNRIRPGQDLTYTISYANNSGGPLNNVRIKVTWNFWSVARPTTLNADQFQQHCLDTGVNACAPLNISGSSVTRSSSPDYNSTTKIGSFTYTLNDGNPIPNGASGSFQIALRVPEFVFPVFGKDPRRPSASAEFYVGNESTARAIANGSALVEGPLFKLEKERTASGLTPRIFPTQTGEYRLRLTNVDREDAITATNVQLTDIVPFGAEFVSSVRGPDRTNFPPTQITIDSRPALVWTIPQLQRGQSIDIFVTFRKLDLSPCDRMTNRRTDYYVTSDEMPFKLNTTERYTIAPQTGDVTYNVRPPVEVVFGSTQTVIFGERGSFTFKVRNYWPQPLNNLQVKIELQPNVRYVPGSASNVGSFTAQPPSAGNGGILLWTFNIPAGNINTPVEQSFSFEVTARYSTTGNGTGSGTTIGSVVVPSGVPSNCNVGDMGGFKVMPRLVVAKYSEAEKSGTTYIARNNQPFEYVISLTNNGSSPMTNIEVHDLLPAGNGADFSYVLNSATIDDGDRTTAIPFEPAQGTTVVGSTERQILSWSGIVLNPGETRYIRYSVITRGQLQTRTYCNDLDRQRMMNALNNPDTNQPPEEITFASARACVRIIPNIQVSKFFSDANGANLGTTKVITGPVPVGGQELYFTLTITNAETTATYTAGLVDFAPPELAFRSVVATNLPAGKQQPDIVGNNPWAWPTLSIPPGQTYTVRIQTLFNPACVTAQYKNQVGYDFFDPTAGSNVRISPRPPVEVVIDYRCGTNRLDYEIKVDRTTLGLRDRGIFTLTVRNLNTNAPLNGVRAFAILPLRYIYSETSNSNQYMFTGQRALSDGRTELSWNVAPIPASGVVNIIFRAAAADIITTSDVYAYATADNLLSATCRSSNRCTTYTYDGQQHTVAWERVTTQPLHTYTPRISGLTECAVSGEERLYSLTMLNTNVVPYRNTTVTLTLPIGLTYLRPDTGMPAPSRVIPITEGSQAGSTQLIWEGLTVPAKPTSGNVSELPLAVWLRVGQVWSDQATRAEVSSPDGVIPITDGEVDPTVRICINGPAIAKTASVATVPLTGSGSAEPTFLYQIEVVNPTTTSMTVTLRDVLPVGVTYRAMLTGPAPAISNSNGRTVLTWTNRTVPAQSGDTPGRLTLLFRVTVNPAQVSGNVVNTVEIVSSSVAITNQFLEAPVELVTTRSVFVPVIMR